MARQRHTTRAEQAGMALAAMNVPRTFQRTLMHRSDVDQGLITGMTIASTYVVGAFVQDAVDSVAMRISEADPNDEAHSRRWRRTAMVLDVAVLGAGLLIQSTNKQEPGEPSQRATFRTAGFWLAEGATAGFIVGLSQEVLQHKDADGKVRVRSANLASLAGAGTVAGALEMRRRFEESNDSDSDELKVSGIKSIIIGGAVTGTLLGITRTERWFASSIAKIVSTVLPGSSRFWRPAGHAAALWVAWTGVKAAVGRAYNQIEDKAELIEPAFAEAPTTTNVSGSPDSLIPWATLSKQGRRNVSMFLHPDWIKAVMHEDVAATPIRVFVGQDSAETDEDRVQLGIEELRRTGAFDRSVLLLISPTGTGYTNYVAVESTEFLTRGDCASLSMQYAKRPSFLSLDLEPEGGRQFRMLVDAVHAEIEKRPKKKSRPRVFVFGESLGAWTSQDAFAGSGTEGLVARGIDRAVWIGSPFGSRWHTQFRAGDPNFDMSLVGEFNGFDEVMALPEEAQQALRYVMISHYNDAVVQFSPDLMVQAPTWLQAPARRPLSVPKSEHWVSPTTFFQTLVDMKNAANVVPGVFEAKGHDYRADLPRFLRFTWDLPATDEQLQRMTEAMRTFEERRAEFIKVEDVKPKKPARARAKRTATPKATAKPAPTTANPKMPMPRPAPDLGGLEGGVEGNE